MHLQAIQGTCPLDQWVSSRLPHLTGPSSTRGSGSCSVPSGGLWLSSPVFPNPQHTVLHASTAQSTHSASCLQGPVGSDPSFRAPQPTSRFVGDSLGASQPLKHQTRLNASGMEWDQTPISNPRELCSPQEDKVLQFSLDSWAGRGDMRAWQQ